MGWALLADAVVLVHLGFILFALCGAALLPRRAWLVALHLPALAWGTWIELSGGICPLTPLENRLRHAAGEQGYAGGFVAHYLLPLIYPEGLTQPVQWLLAAVLLAVNAALYLRWWRLARSARAAGGGRGAA
jgi:hypothetical protein